MEVLLETHLVLAFLVALCALVFSWNTMGRRVVNAVVVLQVLVGLAIAGVMGASHQAMPPMILLHLVIGVVILGCYGMAMRFGKQAGGAAPALLLSLLGLALVLANIYLGWHMAGRV